jgi:hypothetical protein
MRATYSILSETSYRVRPSTGKPASRSRSPAGAKPGAITKYTCTLLLSGSFHVEYDATCLMQKECVVFLLCDWCGLSPLILNQMARKDCSEVSPALPLLTTLG